MSHPIDKLFKDKLAQYQVQPSADAWNNLQLNQQQKKQYVWKNWMAIAASVLIIVVSGILLTRDNQVTYTPVVMEEISSISLPEKPVVEPLEVEQQHISKALNPVPDKEKVKEIKEKVTEKNPVVDRTPVEVPKEISGLKAQLAVELKVNQSMESADLPLLEHQAQEQQTIIDKIANTALEIKNGDGLMAELRQFKDDVVSLEFFKSKKSI